MKNITLCADERLIEEAREQASARNTTLNDEFRRWLSEYACREGRGERARRAIEETRNVFRTHGPFTRDELNARMIDKGVRS
jgi:hypothetical protein